MITTTGQRSVAGCSVYMDDTDPLQVYVVPESPHIAVDKDGKPVFSLIEYRRPVDHVSEADRATKLGGGLLTFSVDLARTPEQETAIRQAISSDPGLQQLLATPATDRVDYSHWWNTEIGKDVGKLAAAVKINALPVTDGSVAVSIDGEDAQHAGEFVSTLVGAGKVSMTADERAAFSAKLTMDGAALLWEAVEKNLATIWVGYQLSFTARLDGVTMVCHCDTQKVYSAMQEQWQDVTETGSYRDTSDGSSTTHTYDHASSSSAGNVLHKIAVDTEAAFVHVTPSAGPDVVKPEMIQELTTQGWNMITAFLADKLLQSTNPDDFSTKDDPTATTQLADGGGGRKYGADEAHSYSVKSVDETTLGTFDATFQEKACIALSVNPTDNLSNVLNGMDVKQFRTQIELDPQFFRYADVQVSCTTDFSTEPVDAVKVHLEYHGKGQGGQIDQVKDLEFTKADPAPKVFSTYLAAPDQDSYTYAVEVFYTGSDKTYSFSGKSNERVLVLDTDTLGVLHTDVQVGLVDWSRYKAVQVDLSYGSGAQAVHRTLTFDATKQADSWVAVLGAQMTGDYTYQVTWVDTSGQPIKVDPATAHDRLLVLDQPLQQDLQVTLVPAGSFGDGGLLSRIVTALKYDDTAHSYEKTETVSFTSAQDIDTWTVPLMDPKVRAYQYQVNVFYSDGVTRTDGEWTTTDRTVLPVGDPYGYKVQFIPNRLGAPAGTWSMATLHVAFHDEAGKIDIEQDFSISDFTQPVFWRFRLAAADRHSYTYQLTLYGADPSKPPVVQAPVTETKSVVVLSAS